MEVADLPTLTFVTAWLLGRLWVVADTECESMVSFPFFPIARTVKDMEDPGLMLPIVTRAIVPGRRATSFPSRYTAYACGGSLLEISHLRLTEE